MPGPESSLEVVVIKVYRSDYVATHVLGPFTLLQAVAFLLFLFKQRVSSVHFPKILFAGDSFIMRKKKKKKNWNGPDSSRH